MLTKSAAIRYACTKFLPKVGSFHLHSPKNEKFVTPKIINVGTKNDFSNTRSDFTEICGSRVGPRMPHVKAVVLCQFANQVKYLLKRSAVASGSPFEAF